MVAAKSPDVSKRILYTCSFSLLHGSPRVGQSRTFVVAYTCMRVHVEEPNDPFSSAFAPGSLEL